MLHFHDMCDVLLLPSMGVLRATYFTPLTTNNLCHYPDYYKMPAITFCNRNLIKRTYFCGKYPDLCSKPNNLTEFCEKHPYMCKGDVSKLVIPMFGYYTNSSTRTLQNITKILQQLFPRFGYYTNVESYSSEYYENSSTACFYCRHTEFKRFPEIEMEKLWEEVYVMDTGILPYTRCYSYNLRVFDKNNQTTRRIVMQTKRGSVSVTIQQKKEESLFPWSESQVFLSVHSPFTPENAIEYGHVLKSGFKYGLIARLEEEHLLPAPYATNCTDYEALWFQNNKTGARSHDMCQSLCSWNYSMETRGCEYRLNMFHKWENICPDDNPGWGDFSAFVDCLNNCKPDCLKLKYIYTVTEAPIEPSHENNFKVDRGVIQFDLYVRDHDVTVISHVPLYGDWELFSYVGGLIGCWLGISVWAFVGLGENFFRKTIQCLMKLREKREKNRNSAF
ncbi:hypothetical protein HNY73_006642 [Argiope bruennichi]|uniref:Uncharacterized protein n=1 Tax=Argiope bruennichi TaxID=94029 RepID=A0A8T0FBH9_ARGBR|nr:hypothetical protein HNY73_006642 [Argiope bruennichi]